LIPSLAPRTRVVIVRHPRERYVPIGTARMAHLALAGSALVDTIDVDAMTFDDAAVLFPGEGARPLAEFVARPPSTLVVIDGTWAQARSLLRKNPKLASLPRIAYEPKVPGNYRIRKEPAAHCLATVEAIAAVLGALEEDVDAYESLLKPFTWMVDRQIDAASSTGRHRTRTKTKATSVVDDVARDALQRGVLAYAEANAHPRSNRAPGAPELLHLVAVKLDSGAMFEARLRPLRPLPHEVVGRLGGGEFLEERSGAVARFRDFVDRAPLVLWGPYARDLLAAEGESKRGFVDLRQLAARILGRSPGGIERAEADVVRLHARRTEPREPTWPTSPTSPGSPLSVPRASRMLSSLATIARCLADGSVSPGDV
jgi:DTW domain-containing protein YfiP